MSETFIADDVKKIKCQILDDGSYKCDIIHGKNVSWFAKCMGNELKKIDLRGYRPHQIQHVFSNIAQKCRWDRNKMEREYKSLPRRKTDTWFARDIVFGKGIKEMDFGKDEFKLKWGSNTVCLFDEDSDTLTCSGGVLNPTMEEVFRE